MRFPIIDLHEDLIMHISRPDLFNGVSQTSWKKLEDADVRVVCASGFAAPDNQDYLSKDCNQLIEKDFEAYAQYCDSVGTWRIVRSKSDLQSAAKIEGGKRGLILHIEGLNAIEDTDSDWSMLEKWYQMGLRSIGPVWNISNSFGGGTQDDSQTLTPLGEKLVRWLDDKGMVLDFAHMNRPTFYAAKDIWKKPILVSHGNSDALTSNPRNYTDEQLRLIRDSGGVIGVFFSGKYLKQDTSNTASLDDAVEHIDYMIKIAGIDTVALGTDFGGITTGLPTGLESVDCLNNLFDELKRRGYTDSDIEHISYKNALRTLTALLA